MKRLLAVALLLLIPVLVLGKASVGGNKAPDGTEIAIDLPGSEHRANVSSRGQGCCVQTSINHSARWQGVPALIDFQKWVQEKGLPGGAYPGAIDDRIPRCCKDRGYPVAEFIQIEGSDLEILKTAIKSGRMLAITYSRSPTGRYGGGTIAHMTNCVHFDDKFVCILDNNFVTPAGQAYEWMSPEEFMKVCNPRGYWCVILLSPGPPPPPMN